MEAIKLLIKHIKPKFRVLMVFGFVLSIGTSLMHLIDPVLTSRLFDEVIVPGNPDPLIPILAMMLIAQVVRMGGRYLMVVMFETASQDMLVNMRTALFRKLQYQDVAYFHGSRTGDLMTRLQSDLDYCRHVMAWLVFQITDNVTLLVAALILFFTTNWQLTVLLLLVVPFTTIVAASYLRRVRGKFRERREKMADMNIVAQENIAGNRVVKAFVRETYEKERFDQRNQAFKKINLDVNKAWLSISPLMESTVLVMSLITVFVGGFFIMNGSLTPGELAMFTSLSFALTNPIRSIGSYIDDMQRFSASAAKVMEIYYANPEVVDRETAKDHDGMKGDVCFENVTFRYEETLVLKNVSLSVKAGQTLAIMGPTGSGKTSLINLITRLYDVQSGAVLVDGVDVRDWKLQQLRSHIGIATQDVFLFSDSIENNIAFSDMNMTEEQAREFARLSAVDEFAAYMPEGYETIIGERGVGLSGGQRQRIALARALASKPSILILDDTTSALDMETEKYIQDRLRELPFSCTKIIIAQRVSSVKDADEILILENGEITERGTHSELLEKKGYYYETYTLQNDIGGGDLR